MPRVMRSGCAAEAGETTTMREPGATAGGLSNLSAKQNLACGDEVGRAGENDFRAGT